MTTPVTDVENATIEVATVTDPEVAQLADAQLADAALTVDVIDSEVVFDGAIWEVRRERFAYGADTLVREYVHHPGSVAVLVVDEADRVLSIQQYRHSIRARDWELPAGLLDVPGEDPMAAAQRELAEEVDLVAAHWEPLLTYHTTPGGSNELVRVFRATGLSATSERFTRDSEEADIVQRWVPLDELVDAVLAGRVRNGLFQAAVLAEHARRTRG